MITYVHQFFFSSSLGWPSTAAGSDGEVSYFWMASKSPLTSARAATDRVQLGTRNSRAGWAWSKMYMAAKVAQMPAMYPRKQVRKQGILIYLTLVTLAAMALSRSNLRHSPTKMPGMTMSPSPSMLIFSSPSALRQGNSNLMGMSSFLATVTITSVPQTQKMSQKNKNHSSRKPTLKLDRSMFLRAMMANNTPNTLLSAQYLVRQYSTTGIDTKKVQMRLPGVMSKSSISSRDLMNLGGLTCWSTRRYEGGKGRLVSSSPLDEITVAMLNWAVSSTLTRCSLTYLQIRQNPNKKAEATSGNLRASFWPIFSLSFYFYSSTSALSLPRLSLQDRMVPRQTQQQLLMSSWGNTGSRCRQPPILASRISTEATMRSAMYSGCGAAGTGCTDYFDIQFIIITWVLFHMASWACPGPGYYSVYLLVMISRDSLLTYQSEIADPDTPASTLASSLVEQAPPAKQRLNSLDILRGLTMVGMILVDCAGPYPPWFIDHAQWDGLTPADLIFPSFVFIMGMAVPLAISKNNPYGYRSVLRTVALFGIGVLLNLIARKFTFDHFRVLGILQRASVCYALLSLVHYITGYGDRAYRIVGALVAVACALIYVVFMVTFENVEIDCPHEKNLGEFCNFGAYADRKMFGQMHMIYPNDPEGLFTNLSAFLNAYAGYWFCLIMQDNKNQTRKIMGLWITVSLLLGSLVYPLTLLMPINKKIWSISFVFLTCAVTGLSLAFITFVVDILGARSPRYGRLVTAITQPFVWLGRNPLAIFVLMDLVCIFMIKYIFVGERSLWGAFYHYVFASWISNPHVCSAIFAVFFVVLWTLVAGLLHRFKIFIKL